MEEQKIMNELNRNQENRRLRLSKLVDVTNEAQGKKRVVQKERKPHNDDEILKMLNTKFNRSHLPEGYVIPLEQRTSF